ncbi:hypothetical protein FRB91_003094 [Serendipita sp. 411]|nr:hypothetical protein FRB91_003094 [Serendipita sp. 411]
MDYIADDMTKGDSKPQDRKPYGQMGKRILFAERCPYDTELDLLQISPPELWLPPTAGMHVPLNSK